MIFIFSFVDCSVVRGPLENSIQQQEVAMGNHVGSFIQPFMDRKRFPFTGNITP